MRRTTLVLVVLLVIALIGAFIALTSPDGVGGSSSSEYTGPVRTTSLVLVSQKTWKRKGQVRHIGHHITVTKIRTRSALTGPCLKVEAEVHGDSWAIDKVIQGLGHFKVCDKAGDRSKINDKYSGASSDHRESWLWGFDNVDLTKGAGVSSTWCNGGVGPCNPVEYRYWRFTFHWKQGVSVFGQDFAHHKTLYIGCTLRAGAGGYQCGTGEA